jgi:hypothetical protein
VGHYPAQQAPDVVVPAVLDFLAGLPGSAGGPGAAGGVGTPARDGGRNA